MHKRLLLSLLKTRRLARAGFTIAELVIGAAIGAFLITGMMYLVVEMTRVERTQTARGETEREMAQALDYIANELREAVLVYDRNCLRTNGSGNGATCPGLTLPVNTVLAFWKREPVPDLNFLNLVPGPTDQAKIENYANAGSCTTNPDCNSVMNYVRTQYTLVIYVLCPNKGRPGPNCCNLIPVRNPGDQRGLYGATSGSMCGGLIRVQFQNRLVKLDPLENPTWPGGLLSWNGPDDCRYGDSYIKCGLATAAGECELSGGVCIDHRRWGKYGLSFLLWLCTGAERGGGNRVCPGRVCVFAGECGRAGRLAGD
jgi:type II secretory pathway pseudopilin PulG